MVTLEVATVPMTTPLAAADRYLKSLGFHSPDQATVWIREMRDARR